VTASPAAAILTSAVGLGVYIPALLVRERLRALGQAADVEVLEEHYVPARLRDHVAHRKAHHGSFALAQMANRMARDVQHCLDEDRVQALLGRWAREGRSRFVVWSGFWLPLLERYRALVPQLRLDIDHCRIDADVSASFRIFPELRSAGAEVWLWEGSTGRIVHEIPVGAAAPVAFARRGQRLAVHGGGWGIGTYRDTLAELAQAGYATDLVVHDPAEASGRRGADRCFMLDPAWEPWLRDADGGFRFPPMIDPGTGAALQEPAGARYHAFHDVIRQARAIVSKPGGCTLIDSLAAATPVILLEAYGEAEQRNARIWEHLGYGMSLANWRASGYSAAVLEQLHRNILARPAAAGYPREWTARLAAEATAA
jgi:hypothetical protein